MREATFSRKTNETDIKMSLSIYDGKAPLEKPSPGLSGTSGVGFFDHMLNSFAVHGGFGISLEMKGDLDVDCHHTIEDVGIVLGTLFARALGARAGIVRFGNAYVPMDESLAFCAVDISGRPFLVFNAEFFAPSIGSYDTQMTEEFFRALAVKAGMTLHINLQYGKNAHHCTEAIFKAAARAISAAAAPTGGEAPLSAKGVL